MDESGLDFDDLDFDLDFNVDVSTVKLEIEAVVANLDIRDRQTFCIQAQSVQLENLIDGPPTKNQVYKMLSGKKGFSSIAIIQYIAKRETICELYVSTFRIGQKQMEVLDSLADRIENACFVTSILQGKEENKDKYNYGEYCQTVCSKNGWRYIPFNNHSKIILMKTDENWYVCETSSNLNENPKLEQYSFENNQTVYEFYRRMFEAICSQSNKRG